MNISPDKGIVSKEDDMLVAILWITYLEKVDFMDFVFWRKKIIIGLYKTKIPRVERKLSHSERLIAEFGLNRHIKKIDRPSELRLSDFLKKAFPNKYIIIITPDLETDGVKQVIAINDKIPMQEKTADSFSDIFSFLKSHIKKLEIIAKCIPEVAKKWYIPDLWKISLVFWLMSFL